MTMEKYGVADKQALQLQELDQVQKLLDRSRGSAEKTAAVQDDILKLEERETAIKQALFDQ
jgi:hypothetical protein